MINRFRSQDAPSGASIKFMTDFENATSIQVQKQLLDGDAPLTTAIDAEIKKLVLRLRTEWDLNKARNHALNALAVSSREVAGVEIEVVYSDVTKRVEVLVVLGYARRLSAVVDLENDAIGSVSFEPSKLLYSPGAVVGGKKGVVPPPPPPAPSNAPRLAGGGALKA